MKTFFIALRAFIYVTGFVFLWSWVALSVRSLDRSLEVVLPAWTRTLGIILGVIGGLLGLLCVGVFVAQGRGTPAPFDAPEEFVAVGPYRYVRNPMYIGGLTVLIGFGLYERSVSILFLCLLVFLLVHLFVIFYEEPTLREKFGATYEEYCRTVSRWIPGAIGAKRNG